MVLCSECFYDEGLKLSAFQIGVENDNLCENCGSKLGRKLDEARLTQLAHRFFVWGTLHRCDYGAAPIVQFNQHQKTSIASSTWIQNDIHLFEKVLKIGFFHYGPRLWMVGEVEPLKELIRERNRKNVLERVLKEYPTIDFSKDQFFYRIRINPEKPHVESEYDSPPLEYSGNGRLDSTDFSILYGSQDLQVCIHECRVSAEDEIFVATFQPTRTLKLLDLTAILKEDCTEFESLDMAVHMLFLAGKHSYEISRELSRLAKAYGYDGIAYPSYFSLLRSGGMPFETTYGMSHRLIPQLHEYEKSKIIQNLALFGKPLNESKISIKCINRLVLHTVEYGVHFGPVEY